MAKEKQRREVPVVALDPIAIKALDEHNAIAKGEKDEADVSQGGMLGAILKSLKNEENKAVRMAFEIDPQANYVGAQGMYRLKTGLTPDHIIKRVCGPSGDDLVCQILQARSNMLASFGRPRTSRFAIGFEFEELTDAQLPEDEKSKEALQNQLNVVKKYLWNCGIDGLDEEVQKPNLSQFLKMITRDGLAYGRLAVEFLYQPQPDGSERLYAFRAVDAGTIYRCFPAKEQDQTVRREAIRMLERLKNKKIDPERFKKDEYRWVQVIEGRPVQAFTEKELVVYNLYPVTNVEYNGYPLTPIDQAISAIATHINITMHNKLYFQHGRAARGMLVFKSDTIDESSVQKIRLQFHQSINSVQNAWRMPVFAVGSEDEVSWQAIDMQGRDAEFQYLMDNNARVILSAFQMSPEELAGYSHLARGSNTQALSESNNEYKLEAQRDSGLRPLLYDIQDFLNTHLLSRINPELAKTHQIILAGLEKDDPEKESTRLQQDMAVHMTYNDVLEKVEKDLLPRELGGEMPLNPQFQQMIEKYLTCGEILENFFGRTGASKDPRYQFVQNPYWMQNQQLLLQKAQLAVQQQMSQQQMMMGATSEGGEDDGHDHDDEGDKPPPSSTGDKEEDAKKMEEWISKNYEGLAKRSKSNHNRISKIILNRHRQLVDSHLEQWKEDSKKMLKDVEKTLTADEKDNK